jgi:hypothetical protein
LSLFREFCKPEGPVVAMAAILEIIQSWQDRRGPQRCLGRKNCIHEGHEGHEERRRGIRVMCCDERGNWYTASLPTSGPVSHSPWRFSGENAGDQLRKGFFFRTRNSSDPTRSMTTVTLAKSGSATHAPLSAFFVSLAIGPRICFIGPDGSILEREPHRQTRNKGRSDNQETKSNQPR